MSLEIIFAEFGDRSKANQKWNSNIGRLDPTYSQIKKYFPEAKIVCYTDDSSISNDYDVEVRLVDSNDTPFDRNYREGSGKLKWGYHCCDYYQVQGLLDSKADIAISIDSDLMFVSDEVKTLLPIIKKFGICCPQNERQLVKIDGLYSRGNDGDYHIGEDESGGNILTYDLWWIGFGTKDERGRKWLKEFQKLMETNPKRGPLQLSRASWNTGIYPYSTPIQWSVGSGHIGCGNEIILHVGHTNVQDHYLEERI
jgi:hypothetical protein|tara:strand:- start:4038 stop:4799 length:762 start_codon:yes stop_codon:yes gene_type:complete